MAICKFIKYKKIQDAMRDLELVIKLRKPVPMKGEIPHRKGEIMSGRYPKRSSEEFIKILKGLLGNANANDINEPIIITAFANKASRPYGRMGQIKKKRTHVTIIAVEKSKLKTKSKENKK